MGVENLQTQPQAQSTRVIASGISHPNSPGGPPIYDHLINTNTGEHYWIENEEAVASYDRAQTYQANQPTNINMDAYSGLSGGGFGNINLSGIGVNPDFSSFSSYSAPTGSGAVGNKEELQRMLESYKGRASLIQSAQRQKAIYTIDRFDGGLNLNKSPRDLADWEACSLNELTPSKIGRLIRLGDFTSTATYTMVLNGVEQENYGLHYFKWSDSVNDDGTLDGGSPSNYLAYTSGDGGVDLWNFSDASGMDEVSDIIAASKFDNAYKPVYHSAENRLYVSDANLSTTSSKDKTMVCGIIDRPSLYPYTSGTSVSYNISGATASKLFKSQDLYHAAPIKGFDAGEINVVGTQSASTFLNGISNAAGQHNGIYMNINFEDILSEDISGTGWGGTESTGDGAKKYYYIYASFLYDNGSETKLTPVSDETVGPGANDANKHTIVAQTTTSSVYQKMVIKQVYIDGTEFYTNFPRVHGARFYYTEADGNDGDEIGDDKYLFAELDFRYGLKLISEFGNWNLFDDETSGPVLAAIQVLNARSDDGSVDEADGTLSISSPPTVFTYYSLNLFHQEELKDDLMWKTSTIGNGIAFIGNVKYDGREYADVMLYSGAGETDSGSAYPMWGTFPVDSNRIDMPGTAGEITALKWINNKVLQFRNNAMYLIDVKDVLSPSIDGVYQGMGASGQYAVTETPFGVAWVNSNGVYAYNSQENKVKSLTIGRIDTEDFGANSNSKIGYDDRAKMLIIGNFTLRATDGYHYAYSFITDSWCTWNTNANSNTAMSNFAINHDGYLTGGTTNGGNIIVNKWSANALTAVAVEYITKDIDFGKPSLDKRLYTLYISYTGGGSQSGMNVYFRVNGKEGADLANGWYQLETLQDYTDPYFTTESSAWNDSAGIPVTGDPTINLDTGLNSTSVGEVQKLAKINLRNLGSTDTVDDTDTSVSTFPKDYLKFARSIQFKIAGTASTVFEINDISLIYKEKRIK
jgi:hypothetical protein